MRIALHYILVASCAAIVYRSRAHSAYQVPLLVLFSAVQTVPEILPHAGQCPCTACRTFVSHHHLSITIGSIGSIGSRRGDPTHRPSGSRRSPAFAPKRWWTVPLGSRGGSRSGLLLQAGLPTNHRLAATQRGYTYDVHPGATEESPTISRKRLKIYGNIRSVIIQSPKLSVPDGKKIKKSIAMQGLQTAWYSQDLVLLGQGAALHEHLSHRQLIRCQECWPTAQPEESVPCKKK